MTVAGKETTVKEKAGPLCHVSRETGVASKVSQTPVSNKSGNMTWFQVASHSSHKQGAALALPLYLSHPSQVPGSSIGTCVIFGQPNWRRPFTPGAGVIYENGEPAGNA